MRNGRKATFASSKTGTSGAIGRSSRSHAPAWERTTGRSAARTRIIPGRLVFGFAPRSGEDGVPTRSVGTRNEEAARLGGVFLDASLRGARLDGMSNQPTMPAFAATTSRLVALLLLVALAGDGASRERTDRFGDPLPPGVVARIGTARWWVGPSADEYGSCPLVYTPDGKSLAACYEGKAVR